MDVSDEVLSAVHARADALAAGDAGALGRLLHEDFRWVTHTGDWFTREAYIDRNTSGAVRWLSQELTDVSVAVVGDTAVVVAEVVDAIEGNEGPETFRMPVTQVWVRQGEGWQCLAGHAGPRRQRPRGP
jgi:ketosteroid isomerase-like protein